MKDVSTWSNAIFHSLSAFGEKLMTSLPIVIGAILILLFGWLFARILSEGIGRLLKVIKFDKLAGKIKAQDFLMS